MKITIKGEQYNLREASIYLKNKVFHKTKSTVTLEEGNPHLVKIIDKWPSLTNLKYKTTVNGKEHTEKKIIVRSQRTSKEIALEQTNVLLFVRNMTKITGPDNNGSDLVQRIEITNEQKSNNEDPEDDKINNVLRCWSECIVSLM